MILKNLTYDPIHRLDLFQLPTTADKLNAYLKKIAVDGNPITADEPWQLQEFLAGGIEYAAMIVVRANRLVTMTCCPSSASQLNYVHIEIPAIRKWLEDFMAGLDSSSHVLTGQLCFDFMVVEEDGHQVAYPIECNPRVHTQCTIYNRDDVRAVFGSLLLENKPITEEHLVDLLKRDYDEAENAEVLNVFWFYNEFFKIFPNSWLLKYNDDKDGLRRKKMVLEDLKYPTYYEALIALLYLPAIVLVIVLAAPVLLCLAIISQHNDSDQDLSTIEHVKVVTIKSREFLRRLASLHKNIEGDLWVKDPFPFFAKNHIQVPTRLLASIRTGVEWKKIDFAIGKVVEVGGD